VQILIKFGELLILVAVCTSLGLVFWRTYRNR
jgi:hypothetical protein